LTIGGGKMKKIVTALLFLSVVLYAENSKSDETVYVDQEDRYAECDVRLDECSEICDKKDDSDNCYSACQKEYDDCTDEIDKSISEQ